MLTKVTSRRKYQVLDNKVTGLTKFLTLQLFCLILSVLVILAWFVEDPKAILQDIGDQL